MRYTTTYEGLANDITRIRQEKMVKYVCRTDADRLTDEINYEIRRCQSTYNPKDIKVITIAQKVLLELTI